MVEVNWILSFSTHGSPYHHWKPPTSLLTLPNHMAEWAYETHRVCTVCMAFWSSTAHSPQWAGTWQGGPKDREGSVTFSFSPLGYGRFRYYSIRVKFTSESLSLPLCDSVAFFLKARPLILTSFPLSGNISILRCPRSIGSFLMRTDTFHPPHLAVQSWWERRQRTFLHSWVLDPAFIATPERETRSFSVCLWLCLAKSHLFVYIFVFSLTAVILKLLQSSPGTNPTPHIRRRGSFVIAQLLAWSALCRYPHAPTLFNIPSLSKVI